MHRARAVGAAVLLAACGYTFAAAPGILALTSGTPVQVVPFANNSLEANASTVATAAVSRGLVERGATLANHPGALVLTGAVDYVNAGPVGTGTWRVDARLHAQLVDPEHGNKVLGHATVVDYEPYLSGDDVEGSEVARQLAVNRLLTKMATVALDRLAP